MQVWRVQTRVLDEQRAVAESYWTFVAAPDRDTARRLADYVRTDPFDVGYRVTARRVGDLPIDEPRELTESEIEQVGWRFCEECGQYEKASSTCDQACD